MTGIVLAEPSSNGSHPSESPLDQVRKQLAAEAAERLRELRRTVAEGEKLLGAAGLLGNDQAVKRIETLLEGTRGELARVQQAVGLLQETEVPQAPRADQEMKATGKSASIAARTCDANPAIRFENETVASGLFSSSPRSPRVADGSDDGQVVARPPEAVRSREEARKLIQQALELGELRWPETDSSDNFVHSEREIGRADIVFLTRFNRKRSKAAIRLCQERGAILIRLPSGYGLNEVLHRTYEQMYRRVL